MLDVSINRLWVLDSDILGIVNLRSIACVVAIPASFKLLSFTSPDITVPQYIKVIH